jgi:hypothetical protein
MDNNNDLLTDFEPYLDNWFEHLTDKVGEDMVKSGATVCSELLAKAKSGKDIQMEVYDDNYTSLDYLMAAIEILKQRALQEHPDFRPEDMTGTVEGFVAEMVVFLIAKEAGENNG